MWQRYAQETRTLRTEALTASIPFMSGHRQCSESPVTPMMVLTAGDGVGTGKVFHYFEGKFDYHQRVYKISDFCPQLDPRFFFEFFKENFIRQVRRFSAKGSVDSVRLEMIRDMDIPLPPLPEQKAIAAVLSAADGEIEALETKLELLKEQKRFLLNNLVMGSIRLPEFVGGGGGGGDE